jgi:aminopeptidase N
VAPIVSTRALTRVEARQRAEIISVASYDVQLDLTGCDAGVATFGTQTRILFSCSHSGASTFAEFRSTEPSQAVLNGRQVPIANGRIALDHLAPENELLVKGRGVYSTAGEGLHRSLDPADGSVYVYSNCFLHDASRVFACFDQPDLKATFQLRVIAPTAWTVISNTPRAATPIDSFNATPQLPTYLVALAAGPYASAHDVWTPPNGESPVPLGLFCRRSLAPHLDEEELFATTKAGLQFYTSQFGHDFPFEKLDQLFAPEFNGGAMENAALVIHMDEMLFRSEVTETERESRAVTLLHELAHMWFGDLVTMTWWDDLWLNEAFATYCSYLATAEVTPFTDAWTTFCIQEKTNARAADLRPSRHPVSGDVIDTDAALLNFDAISYNKGASLLRQLSERIGRDTFFSGVSGYFAEHAWGNTDLNDFIQALMKAGGGRLEAWSNDYLKTVGCPTIGVEAAKAVATGERDDLTLWQKGSMTDQRVGIGLYQHRDDRLTRVRRLDVELTGQSTPLSNVASDVPEVVLANEGDWAYASIELDIRSLAAVSSIGVSSFDESLPRALVWGSLWDMTGSGRLAAAQFIEQVATDLALEDNVPIIELLLERARIASERLVNADLTAELRTALAEACFEAGLSAEPRSGRRLALVHGELTFATTSEQLDRIAALLDGPEEQLGLLVDADLRWRLLRTLAAMGQRSSAAIESELVRDETAFGHHHAARARAALFDATAKETAWAYATGAAATSTNRTVAESCLGFWQWNQRDLCRPFVSDYFAVLDEVWSQRDTEIAQQMTNELFPALYTEVETLNMVDAHLARPDLPAGQRRILLDRRYDLSRALDALEALEARKH